MRQASPRRGLSALTGTPTEAASHYQLKIKIEMEVLNQILVLVAMVVAVVFKVAVFTSDVMEIVAAVKAARMLWQTAAAWQQEGPHTTPLGKLREHLASCRWLGPLRPDPALNPLEKCGVEPDLGWRVLLRRLGSCERRLACLQEHIRLANKEHMWFSMKVTALVVVVGTALVTVVLLQCVSWWRRGTPADTPAEEPTESSSDPLREEPTESSSDPLREEEKYLKDLVWHFRLGLDAVGDHGGTCSAEVFFHVQDLPDDFTAEEVKLLHDTIERELLARMDTIMSKAPVEALEEISAAAESFIRSRRALLPL